jgi:hypothetical protein
LGWIGLEGCHVLLYGSPEHSLNREKNISMQSTLKNERPQGCPRAVVFKLCAAALWGAVRNSKGAANFFRQYEILQFFYRNLADFSI